MVHAGLLRSALAPTLRMFAGPAPETEFADGAGGRKSPFFRIPFIGKTRLRSSVRDSSLGGKSKAPLRSSSPQETPSAMPVIGEPRKALLPCAPSKTLCIPRSAVKKRRGGPEPQPRAPPAPSSKHVSDAVTSSKNACSKSSTSSSFWNWSSLPQPSWRNSSF